MPLIETVITVLGGAIAKNIVGDWLKDSPLAEKIGEEIVDVIKDTFGDSRSTQHAKHEIDKLGIEIAKRMRVVLDMEARTLDPGALAAIQHETVEALRTTALDLPLLVQFNFDGYRLARHISDLYKINRAGLSADEIGLYRRLVQEASYGIVATASQLRDFAVQSTAGILDRIDRIISQTAELLERERREAEEFEQRYRSNVERELDRMETFGIPRMDRVTTRQKLSAAYITLSVSHSDKQHVAAHSAAFSRALATDESVREGPINDVLARQQRFAIRGEAGAGKSTLLQWIAVRAATRSFPPDLAHWNSSLPFFIRLRALVNKNFPSMEEFPGLISQNFTGDVVPRRWVDQLLRRGQALVLIDGIDELPLLQRTPFFESLRRLVADYPAATYIVTSRPSGLKDRYGQPWQEWEDL